MRHDRDAGLGERTHRGGVFLSAFHFHRMHQSLFEQPDGGFNGLLGGDLVAAEGKVGHDQCATGARTDRTGKENHVLERDRQRGRMAEDVIRRGISDQQNLNTRLVENLGRVLIVGREHRKTAPLLLCLTEVLCTDAP